MKLLDIDMVVLVSSLITIGDVTVRRGFVSIYC
jgi:hypothetical protein